MSQDKLTPENSGASRVACAIINETFLALDGFQALRAQCNCSTYSALAFAAELARIADREILAAGELDFPVIDWDPNDDTEENPFNMASEDMF